MNAPQDLATSPRANLLLVDDEPLFLDSLLPILNHYGFFCTTAGSGHEAMKILEEQTFDMALLDVELPDMSGCDIAAFIKKSYPAMTSVMLTGKNNVETAVEAMQQGAYDFLAKPVRHEQLIKTIDKALEHNRLQRELLGSEQRFRILSDAAWEAIVIHENGQIIEANSQFYEMFGYDREALQLGLRLESLIAAEKYHQTLLELVDVEERICSSIAIKHGGAEFPVDIKSRKINFLGRSCLVWVIHDLSAKVAAEMEKIDLQKKLASANKLKALGLMAGSVAHDLNNILAGIVSYPDLLLLQMNKDDKHYHHIQKIQAAGRRAAAVVADLVAIARGGGGQVKVVANINDIIADYVNSLEHRERLVRFPGVQLRTELTAKVQNICCSEQQLHKVLLNLIGNAMEAIGDGGIVTIRTENCSFTHPLRFNWDSPDNGEYVRLTVADDGPGIKEQHLEHIFDPFYSTKVMGKSGTGLGLTIVWKIVQDHNGWIEVKNGEKGAVFELYLPATRDQVRSSETRGQINLCHGNGERVLIVDDEVEQTEVLEKALDKLGYKTYSVNSGEEAVAFVRKNSVDLILLDMIIGDGINGRQTYEKILDFHPAQKAIIVSGYAQKEDMDRVRELGVSFFLEKPVTLGRVSMVMRHVLEG